MKQAVRKASQIEKPAPHASSAREEAILRVLRRNGGVGTNRQLRSAMPKEPDLSDEQRAKAYSNTMTKLKHRGIVGRTGDTWSLTDAGSAAA